MRRLTRTLLLTAGLVLVAAAPCYRLTHPRLCCGIPVRDYQYKSYSQPMRSVSAVGIPARASPAAARTTGVDGAPLSILPPPAAVENPVRAFQFVDQPRLIIDHCSVSQMSVLLYQSGDWTVSLRGDQNPVQLEPPLVDRDVTTSEAVKKYTGHLKRNQFIVRIRCYGGNAAPSPGTLLGPPVVIPLEPRPFWVQKEIPSWFVDRGFHAEIKEYFDSIDHVELEFSYRTDQDW